MKPTIPEVLPLVRALYAEHPAGGHLHIVLDDGNIADEHVLYCIKSALDGTDWAQPDYLQVGLGYLLLAMSKTQRNVLVAMPKAAV